MPENPLALLRQLHELLKVGCWRTCSIDTGLPAHTRMPVAPDQCSLLLGLLQLLVDQLRQKCLEEPRSDDRPRGYSALTQDPKECVQEVNGSNTDTAACCGYRCSGPSCCQHVRPACAQLALTIRRL
jgi:hypothetical protein